MAECSFPRDDTLNIRLRPVGRGREPVSGMREFIYVSTGKLDRFGARRPRSINSLSAGAGVLPASASFSVTASDRDDWQKAQVKLRQAVRAIGSAGRWYQDDSVRPGDWVRFGGDFGYSILGSRSFSLFLMTQTPATMRGDVALLLFGSPANALLGRPPAEPDIRDLDSYAGNLLTFVRDLIEADTGELGDPGLGEGDQAAVQLFSRIWTAHDATDHVEGIAKAANVIHGIRLPLPAQQERGPRDGEADDGNRVPSRLVIASPLYVAADYRSETDRHDVSSQDKAVGRRSW
jgi:hypothetical protein